MHVRALGVVFLLATLVLVFFFVKQIREPAVSPEGAGRTNNGPGPITAPLNLPARPSSEIHTEWKSSVERILVQYDQDKNALAARDALVRLTVTAEDREVHLALVLGLSAENNDALNRARASFQQVD